MLKGKVVNWTCHWTAHGFIVDFGRFWKILKKKENGEAPLRLGNWKKNWMESDSSRHYDELV